MQKRTPKIIKDNKQRREWAEALFAARAAENGLPVSKPFGDSGTFDCVVGHPGKFVAVQVKCTMAELRRVKGYICTVKSSHKLYRAGAFDFSAAYVIPVDTWYLIPANLVRGRGSLYYLCRGGAGGKYEEYREAWHLLREASGCGESAEEPVSEPGTPMGPVVVRMQGAMNFFRNYLEKGGR